MKKTIVLIVCLGAVASLSCSYGSPEILAKNAALADSSTLKSITISLYCGECMGRCGDLYTIDKTSITIDTSEYAYFKSNKGVVPPFTIKTDLANTYMRKLLAGYPKWEAFESKRYGHPDSHDQCGVYIGFNFPDKVIAWEIDTDDYSYQDSRNLPKDVIAFRYLITDIIKDINEKLLK